MYVCVYVYVYTYVCLYVHVDTISHSLMAGSTANNDFNVLFAPCCNKCGLLTKALPVIPIPRNSGPLKYQPNPDTPLISTVLPLTYTVCVFMYMCACMCVCVCVCVCVYYNMKLIKVI